MAKKKPGRKDELLKLLLYPLDWLEERSGLVGGVKYFLFRKVPGDISWGHTLGSASLANGNQITKLSCWTTTGFIVLADAVRYVKP